MVIRKELKILVTTIRYLSRFDKVYKSLKKYTKLNFAKDNKNQLQNR